MTKDDNASGSTRSRPVHTERAGRLSVTVFENTYTKQDGSTFTRFELKPERLYDKDGELKNASSFGIDDALRVNRLMLRAADKAMELEAAASKESWQSRAQTKKSDRSPAE